MANSLLFLLVLNLALLARCGDKNNDTTTTVETTPAPDICSVFVECECAPEEADSDLLLINCSGRDVMGKLRLGQLGWPYQFYRDHDNFARAHVYFGKTGLRELSFANSQQIDHGPRSIDLYDMRNLPVTRLSLRGNNIGHVDSGQLNGFSKLTWLDFSHNNLTSIEEGLLGGRFAWNEDINPKVMEKLKVVDLSNNRIERLAKDAFFNVPNLEDLDISCNKIFRLDKHLFDKSLSLRKLDLSNNPIRVIGPHTALAITSLEGLRELRLGSTDIYRMPPGILRPMPNLELLDLSGNRFESIPDELRESSHHTLRSVSFDGNPIQTLDQASFKGLWYIREVNISYMPELTSLGSGTFGPLRSLRVLRLSHNKKLQKLNNEAFKGIATRKFQWPVQEFYISNNSLSTLTVSIVPWDRIQIVDISHNPWICDCRLKWMIVALINQMGLRTPELTKNVTCSGPARYKGTSIASLGLNPGSFCPMGREILTPPVEWEPQTMQTTTKTNGVPLNRGVATHCPSVNVVAWFLLLLIGYWN